MNVLSIGNDRKLFEEGSDVRKRIIDHAQLFNELHIVIFTNRPQGFHAMRVAPNLFLYPTNSRSRWHYCRDALKLANRIKNVSIVTAQDPFETGSVAIRIGARRNIPVHLQVHTDFLNRYFIGESALNVIRLVLGIMNIKRAKRVRVVSDRIKRSLMRYLRISAEKLDVLPIYIDAERFLLAKSNSKLPGPHPEFDPIILTISRLSREKNVKLAIRVLKRMIAAYPRIGLVVVGSGPEKERLQRFAVKRGLGSRVVFEGWQNDTTSYYGSADVYLHTSNYEGYGLTLLEAASAGCPIVSTDVGLIGDVISKENVYACAVGDKRCVEESLIRFLDDRHEAHVRSLRAMNEARHHLIQKDKYLELYRRGLEKTLL